MSNGILYQLPSSHLFIHWVPTKLSNRVMPYGVNYRQLQLLFVFDSYRPTAFFKKTDFQWTLSFVSSVGLVGDAVHFTLHPGFLSRTLPDFRYFLQSGKALEYMIQSCSYVLTVRLVLLYLSTFSSDHMSSLLSGLQKSPSVSYR